MISKFILGKCILLLSIVNLCFAQQRVYKFENLGKPVRSPLSIDFVTRDEVTGPIAWGALTSAENNALIGVNMKDGKLIEVNLENMEKRMLFYYLKHLNVTFICLRAREADF